MTLLSIIIVQNELHVIQILNEFAKEMYSELTGQLTVQYVFKMIFISLFIFDGMGNIERCDLYR